jgi:hypothetical protein
MEKERIKMKKVLKSTNDCITYIFIALIFVQHEQQSINMFCLF